jgi:hypothetical protein
MKNTLLVLFALATIALGAVCLLQTRKVSERNLQISRLRAEADQLVREIADLQSSQKFLQQQSQELFDQSSQLAAKLVAVERTNAQLTSSAKGGAATDSARASARADKNPFGQLMAKMMDDPDMKKMIRDQQRLTLDRLYDPLMKQMGLSPEEATRFKDLLAENMMKGTEKASSLFGGETSTNRTEMLSKLAAEQKSFDEQLKAYLGESRYAQYKDYQQTVGERAQLQQFQQQAAGGGNALTDQQTEQLLAFMNEAKQAVNATGGFGQPQDAAGMQAMLSGGGIEKMLQSQEAISRQVYGRAQTVLSADQLAAFGTFQTNQLQMMRMGMSMAQKLLAPEGAQGAGTRNP